MAQSVLVLGDVPKEAYQHLVEGPGEAEIVAPDERQITAYIGAIGALEARHMQAMAATGNEITHRTIERDRRDVVWNTIQTILGIRRPLDVALIVLSAAVHKRLQAIAGSTKPGQEPRAIADLRYAAMRWTPMHVYGERGNLATLET